MRGAELFIHSLIHPFAHSLMIILTVNRGSAHFITRDDGEEF